MVPDSDDEECTERSAFWQWYYKYNSDKPIFDKPNEYVQFDPNGISPIIRHWIRSKSPDLLKTFPPSVQQMIIYFVLHFQFQANNPVITTNADIEKYEFSAIGSLLPTFGTILFGKAFPSSTTVLSVYECNVCIKSKGRGIGIGVVPNDFNPFLFEHEYFPHHLSGTCVMFDNGQFYGWNGKEQKTDFKISYDFDQMLRIEINMKQKEMRLEMISDEADKSSFFVIKNLPNNSRLAFVMDTRAEICVISQTWKL